MINRDEARRAWLKGLRDPHFPSWHQLPSPTKREFEDWVVTSYDSLHSRIFESRKLKPQYLFSNKMYAYLILKNWKSRIGFGEGKVEDLRQVLDYETYFYLCVFVEHQEEQRNNDWIAGIFEDTLVHLNDSELSDRLLEIANETWKRALETYASDVEDDELRSMFFDFNLNHTDERNVSTKFWWVRKMARCDEGFREWFVESGLAKEAYRLLEYRDK